MLLPLLGQARRRHVGEGDSPQFYARTTLNPHLYIYTITLCDMEITSSRFSLLLLL